MRSCLGRFLARFSPPSTDDGKRKYRGEQYPSSPDKVDIAIAMYDFEPRDEGELRFAQGDRLKIINKEVEGADGWWMAQNTANNSRGTIPSNFVRELKDMDDYTSELWWFDVDRRSAKRQLVLPANPRGTFLVRRSKEANKFSLFVKNFDETGEEIDIKHYYITLKMNAKKTLYCIGPRRQFPSMPELIAHYKEESGGLCCLLTQPCPKEPQTIPFKDFEVRREDIVMTKKLGAGKFGEVWKGTYKQKFDVAVKKMLPDKMSTEKFLEEAKMIHRVHHRCLIQLMGVVTQTDPILIVIEFVEKGNLLDYLKKDKGEKIKFRDVLDIAAQVAEGMAYLENLHCIHRDLRAANILIGRSNAVKIADFGLSRVLLGDEYSMSEDSKFPIKWASPETLDGRKRFTIKSDVWSFGVFLYELVTYGCAPYAGMTNFEVCIKICDGYRMSNPDKTAAHIQCPVKMYEMMMSCWSSKEEERPTFKYLSAFFDDYYIETEAPYAAEEID